MNAQKRSPRRPLPLLLALALALSASAAAEAAVRARVTTSTGVFTLVPRQIVRLHLIDVGTSAALPVTGRLELRNDRGVLVAASRLLTVRPGVPLNASFRTTSLLGSLTLLGVTAVAVVNTDFPNPASQLLFSVETQAETPGSFPLKTVICPSVTMGDPPGPDGPVYSLNGECYTRLDLITAVEE